MFFWACGRCLLFQDKYFINIGRGLKGCLDFNIYNFENESLAAAFLINTNQQSKLCVFLDKFKRYK